MRASERRAPSGRQDLRAHNRKAPSNRQDRRIALALETYRLWTRRLRMYPTAAQHRACIFLIRHGQNFLSDFGYENAPEKAKAIRSKHARRRTVSNTTGVK